MLGTAFRRPPLFWLPRGTLSLAGGYPCCVQSMAGSGAGPLPSGGSSAGPPSTVSGCCGDYRADALAPYTWKVVVTGAANRPDAEEEGYCLECASLDGTYFVPWLGAWSGGACSWALVIDKPCFAHTIAVAQGTLASEIGWFVFFVSEGDIIRHKCFRSKASLLGVWDCRAPISMSTTFVCLGGQGEWCCEGNVASVTIEAVGT